jgi:uncharacterized protein with HEPN domain
LASRLPWGIPLLNTAIQLGDSSISGKMNSSLSQVNLYERLGMRNILAHQYDAVSGEIVWNVVHQDIPELIAMIAPLLDG